MAYMQSGDKTNSNGTNFCSIGIITWSFTMMAVICILRTEIHSDTILITPDLKNCTILYPTADSVLSLVISNNQVRHVKNNTLIDSCVIFGYGAFHSSIGGIKNKTLPRGNIVKVNDKSDWLPMKDCF